MNNLKTLGKVGVHLITGLYEKNLEIFTLKDASEILQNTPLSNRQLLSKLIKRNIIARIKGGKYIIISQQYGVLKDYIGNLYVAAREISISPDYYIAFYSAMNYWGMLPQPLLTTFVATPKRQHAPKAIRKTFRFIYVMRKNIWGVREEQAIGSEKFRISDRERTIIDALAHPEFCGGITEAAKGIWMIKDVVDYVKLGEYAARYGKNVVAKRLGYLLEILDIDKPGMIKTLKGYVCDRYDVFDPMMDKKSLVKNSWRLIDNITPEQIKKVIWS